jgi:RNA polymerase sigma factor (sigma-70 family)
MSEDSRQDHFRSLLAQVQQGSDEAARELYETYVKYVLKCVRHKLWHKMRSQFDSQDFVQQVWASFFDERRNLPDFQTPEDLTNYLLAMTRNKVAAAGRRRRAQKRDMELEIRIEEENDLVGPHPASRDPTPSAVAVAAETRQRLVELQPQQVRTIAQLRAAGHTFAEIAAELAIDESTARRAIRQLREHG